MKLFDYIHKKQLEDAVQKGYINIIKHPTEDIAILNYSKKCQRDGAWSDTSLKCRGLIYDIETEEILAMPFKKFFNYEEFNGILDLFDFKAKKVYEKLDGTLGILYWIGEIPYIATRGSFVSDQALHATEVLHKKYSACIGQLNKDFTYLFEIIYPDDKHIVNYYDIDDIFLIGCIDKTTGKEIDIDDIPDNMFYKVPVYKNVSDWKTVREDFYAGNKEGFVILFENGERIKMKFKEYIMLQSIKYSPLTAKKILDEFINHNEYIIDKYIAELDEESQIYYTDIINSLHNEFVEILNICNAEYICFTDRKKAAEYFSKCTYPNILFAIYDDKDWHDVIENLIWKQIKKEKRYV